MLQISAGTLGRELQYLGSIHSPFWQRYCVDSGFIMLLLSNGLLFDGSGNTPVTGSLLIDGDRIAEVGVFSAPAECPAVDCTGVAIAPGFIDLHSHADLQVLDDRMEKVKQGVTTEVVGNCGFSPFPYSGTTDLLHEFGAGILGKPTGWGWPAASGYLDAVHKHSAKMNVVSLVGHGSLRVAVAGLRQSALSAEELDRTAGLLEDSLTAGCGGFSTGLMYAPGSSAGKDELIRLCSVVARSGKMYATHMRSYSSRLLESTREQLDLARATGCRLQISHLQTVGRVNWDSQQRALDQIEAARKEGVDVEFDIYPYQCGSTVLTQFAPQWAFDGGPDALIKRLLDPGTRRKIVDEIERTRVHEWSDITISAVDTAANQKYVGKTIADIAADRKHDPTETMLDLLVEEHALVNVVSFNQSEPNLRQLLTHPLCSVISDGFYVKGKAHPRLYGTFPELLGNVVRDRRWMPLPESIHKITAKPAARLGLKNRGWLKKGYSADVTIFDPAHVKSEATYETPDREPQGILKVIKEGQIVYQAA